MWFNNAKIYQYQLNDEHELAAKLNPDRLKPCPPHARFIYGWLPACQDELVQEVAGAALFCLGKEERVLPRAVINKILAERVSHIERQQNRQIKRAERAQLAEDLQFELLPQSFCVQKKIPALFDTANKRLIINTASENQASQLLAMLRKSLPAIELKPLNSFGNLTSCFTKWLTEPSMLPPAFQLAADCVLVSAHDEKKRVSCKNYELPAAEIITFLTQNFVVTEISLIWKERIQFTLTEDFTLKRLKTLDLLDEDFAETTRLEEDYLQQDAALTLLAGEMKQLITDLLPILY